MANSGEILGCIISKLYCKAHCAILIAWYEIDCFEFLGAYK